MGATPTVSNQEELEARFTRTEIKGMVVAFHPLGEMAKRSPFEFFVRTYEEVYGHGTCQITRNRLMTEYIGMCGKGPLPDYYVRCLLPGYRGSA